MTSPKTIYTRYLYHHYTTFESKDGIHVTYGRVVCLDHNAMPVIYNIPTKHRSDWDSLQSIDAKLSVKLDLWTNEKGQVTAYLRDYREIEHSCLFENADPAEPDLPL